jgi:hypothetical protein
MIDLKKLSHKGAGGSDKKNPFAKRRIGMGRMWLRQRLAIASKELI